MFFWFWSSRFDHSTALGTSPLPSALSLHPSSAAFICPHPSQLSSAVPSCQVTVKAFLTSSSTMVTTKTQKIHANTQHLKVWHHCSSVPAQLWSQRRTVLRGTCGGRPNPSEESPPAKACNLEICSAAGNQVGSIETIQGFIYAYINVVYIGAIYCQLGDYVLPASFFQNQKNQLTRFLQAFLAALQAIFED